MGIVQFHVQRVYVKVPAIFVAPHGSGDIPPVHKKLTLCIIGGL